MHLCFAQHNSSCRYLKGVVCVRMSHIISLIYTLGINQDQPNEKSKGYLYWAYNSKGVGRCHLHSGRGSKAGNGVGEVSSRRNGGLQLGPDWRLLAWGISKLTRSRVSYLLGDTYVVFSGWKQGQKLGRLLLSPGRLGLIFTELLFSFLDCHWRLQSGFLQKLDLEQAGYLSHIL